MKTLDQIAIECGTDKSSKVHFYTRHYERYFEPLREKPLKILEIGIQNGYSLKMWKEYFPNAYIYGMDIHDCSHMAEDRIKIIQGNQSNPETLRTASMVHGPFDIVIDDGSHHNYDMKIGVEALFPFLNHNGIYVVEDLHTCYWDKTHATGAPVFMDRLKAMLDEVNSAGKSGKADIEKDPTDGEYLSKKFGEMTWWEKNVEFVHLYRHIVFIKRYDRLRMD